MVQLSFTDAEAPGMDGADRSPTSSPTQDQQPDVDVASPPAITRESNAMERATDDIDVGTQAAPFTVALVAKDVAQVATPSTQPAVSLESFISSLKLPLEEPLASSPIRRVSRVDDSVFVPRRSVRLADKAIHRNPIPEKQAKRVLLSKWTHEPAHVSQTPDPAVAAKFHETFAEPLSASQRAALSELYPMAGRRWRRVMHVSD
jgi:hypothetical protein